MAWQIGVSGAPRCATTVYAFAGLTGLDRDRFPSLQHQQETRRLSWQNLFYSAPIGAPAALALSGALGFLAERVRDNDPGMRSR